MLGIDGQNGITSLGDLMACLIVADGKYIMSKYRINKLGYIKNLVAQAIKVEIPFNNYNMFFFAKGQVKKTEQAF